MEKKETIERWSSLGMGWLDEDRAGKLIYDPEPRKRKFMDLLPEWRIESKSLKEDAMSKARILMGRILSDAEPKKYDLESLAFQLSILGAFDPILEAQVEIAVTTAEQNLYTKFKNRILNTLLYGLRNE